MRKKALVTGLVGQDGSYLAELLLSNDYEVHGIVRRVTNRNFDNISHIKDKLNLHAGTMENYATLCKLVKDIQPDEIYHLAAQSYVANSFEDEFSTLTTNLDGTHFLLNAVKDLCSTSKLYFAGTSEMFGNMPAPQNEFTEMNPVSPYGVSKLAAYHLCRYYRRAFKLFIACGILFNHESPRRGKEFVTRKITEAAKAKQPVKLGNLDAKRDWGFAGDYVKAMYLMLQQDIPDDFVVATGETHSVKEFAKLAYQNAGLNWEDYVEVSPEFYRPNELYVLQGNWHKARETLGWKPTVKFEELVEMMMK